MIYTLFNVIARLLLYKYHDYTIVTCIFLNICSTTYIVNATYMYMYSIFSNLIGFICCYQIIIELPRVHVCKIANIAPLHNQYNTFIFMNIDTQTISIELDTFHESHKFDLSIEVLNFPLKTRLYLPLIMNMVERVGWRSMVFFGENKFCL